jgi:hypothetical protein
MKILPFLLLLTSTSAMAQEPGTTTTTTSTTTTTPTTEEPTPEPTTETPADAPADTSNASIQASESPEPAAVVDLDALQPVTVKPPADAAALTDADRKALTELAVELGASIERAAVAVEQFELNLKTALEAWRVAKANVTARKADVKAAKEQVKVDKLGTDAEKIRAAERALEDADLALDKAEHMVKVRSLEHGVIKAKIDRAEALKAMEEAKLAEVQGRLADPALEAGDLLKLEKARAKAETTEAKARTSVTKAQGQLEREKLKAP